MPPPPSKLPRMSVPAPPPAERAEGMVWSRGAADGGGGRWGRSLAGESRERRALVQASGDEATEVGGSA